MGKRTWIDSDIWSDTDDLTMTEKVFYIYLLTNSQRNIAGYYKVNPKYIAIDMGLDKRRIETILTRKQKYWLYDKETEQVLIPKFTRYNIVKSKSQIAALNAELAKLHPCYLHKVFLENFEEVNGAGASELLDEKFKRVAISIK